MILSFSPSVARVGRPGWKASPEKANLEWGSSKIANGSHVSVRQRRTVPSADLLARSFPLAEKETAVTKNRDNLTLGLILIGMGVVFLLTNVAGLTLQNWWALFIFIPAVKQLRCAWSQYQENGRLGHSGRGALTGGLFWALIGSAFLFDLNWGFVWPFFLILGGLGAILGGWFD